MSKAKRNAQKNRRAASAIKILSRCSRCGEPGPHFVPPSFGDTGFFICDPNDVPQPSRPDTSYLPDTQKLPIRKSC